MEKYSMEFLWNPGNVLTRCIEEKGHSLYIGGRDVQALLVPSFYIFNL